MKITNFFKLSQICLELTARDKKEVIEALVKMLIEQGKISKEMFDDVVNALTEREAQISTGLGYGVALPHVTTKAVSQIEIAFGRSSKGIDFDALDGNVVHFFFLILAPTKRPKEYLTAISSISALMKNEKIRHRLLNARSVEEVYKIFEEGK